MAGLTHWGYAPEEVLTPSGRVFIRSLPLSPLISSVFAKGGLNMPKGMFSGERETSLRKQKTNMNYSTLPKGMFLELVRQRQRGGKLPMLILSSLQVSGKDNQLHRFTKPHKVSTLLANNRQVDALLVFINL